MQQRTAVLLAMGMAACAAAAVICSRPAGREPARGSPGLQQAMAQHAAEARPRAARDRASAAARSRRGVRARGRSDFPRPAHGLARGRACREVLPDVLDDTGRLDAGHVRGALGSGAAGRRWWSRPAVCPRCRSAWAGCASGKPAQPRAGGRLGAAPAAAWPAVEVGRMRPCPRRGACARASRARRQRQRGRAARQVSPLQQVAGHTLRAVNVPSRQPRACANAWKSASLPPGARPCNIARHAYLRRRLLAALLTGVWLRTQMVASRSASAPRPRWRRRDGRSIPARGQRGRPAGARLSQPQASRSRQWPLAVASAS